MNIYRLKAIKHIRFIQKEIKALRNQTPVILDSLRNQISDIAERHKLIVCRHCDIIELKMPTNGNIYCTSCYSAIGRNGYLPDALVTLIAPKIHIGN